MSFGKNKKNCGHRISARFFSALTAIALVALMSSSCTKTDDGLSDVFTGTQGLKISVSGFSREILISSFNPESISIPFIATLENKGRHTIGSNDFKLVLSGHDPKLIDCYGESGSGFVIRNCEAALAYGEKFEGKSTLRRIGDKKILTNDMFEFVTKREGISGEIYPFTVLFSLCYRYRTYFSDSLMLDPSSTPQRVDFHNQASTRTHSGGQGAPLGVTRVSSLTLGNKAIVFITVKKLDNVQVYYDEANNPSAQKCGSASYNIRNKFKVTKAELSDFREMSLCTGKTFYLNQNGEGEFTCEFEIRGDIRNEISAILNLELEYDVFDYSQQSFVIRKI